MTELRVAGPDGREMCTGCLGYHEPDSGESWAGWRDAVFVAPYRCLCCGREICSRQFAWGRLCGPCDVGACQPFNRSHSPASAHRPWDPSAYVDEAKERSKTWQKW